MAHQRLIALLRGGRAEVLYVYVSEATLLRAAGHRSAHVAITFSFCTSTRFHDARCFAQHLALSTARLAGETVISGVTAS